MEKYNLLYVAAIATYLNLDAEALYVYIFLLTLDLFTGLLTSFILRVEITTWRFSSGLLSKLLLLSIPITLALVFKLQSLDMTWFINWVMLMLGLSEAISILNNILKSQGKKQIPEIDIISVVAEKLRLALESIIKRGKDG